MTDIIQFINNYSNLATFIASVATFVTAILAYSTLREMARQRRMSYLPDVGMKNLEIPIYLGRANATLTHPELRLFTFMNNLIEVQNIGQGVAKSVGITVEYDVARAVQLIQQYDQGKKFNVSLSTSFINVGSERFNVYYDILRPNYYSTNFILAHDEMGIPIPEGYLILLIIYLYLLRNQDSIEPYGDPSFEFSPLTYTITYQDIAGKSYTKKINAICNFFDPLSIPLDVDGELGKMDISFK